MIIFSSFLLLTFLSLTQAVFDPCIGKAQYGNPCDRDTDCTGFGVTCNQGKCSCNGNYLEKSDKDSNTKYCVKLPDTIGASCPDGSCQYPLFCEGGRCKCIRATTDGNRCYANLNIGDACTKNSDCTMPFSTCTGGKCACINQQMQSGNTCTANQNCPTGAKPQGTCVRTSENIAFLHNYPNSGGKVDNCPVNFYCYTSDQSNFGFCCPQVCPLGSTPEKYSCDPTATNNRCPEATHYCHRTAGQSYSSTVCCRKPCRDPTPVYIKGQCYPVTWLGAPCQTNEHCDGGYGMVCQSGNCNCAPGFKAYSDSYTTGDNPAQTCVRDCGSGISKSGECFKSSALQQSCTVTEQCPQGAACFRGMCFCDCRKGYVKQGSGCAKPPPQQTASGGTGTGTGSNTGTGTGTGGGSIIDLFKGILNKPIGG